jgi:hypothetical protein
VAQVVFAHGAAHPASVVPLGQMLQALGLGLIPFSAQYMLLRGFYAFEDTRTPFWMAVWISTANIALATACHLLMPPRRAVTGLAGAYAASYTIGLLITAMLLQRRLEGRLDGRQAHDDQPADRRHGEGPSADPEGVVHGSTSVWFALCSAGCLRGRDRQARDVPG